MAGWPRVGTGSVTASWRRISEAINIRYLRISSHQVGLEPWAVIRALARLLFLAQKTEPGATGGLDAGQWHNSDSSKFDSTQLGPPGSTLEPVGTYVPRYSAILDAQSRIGTDCLRMAEVCYCDDDYSRDTATDTTHATTKPTCLATIRYGASEIAQYSRFSIETRLTRVKLRKNNDEQEYRDSH